MKLHYSLTVNSEVVDSSEQSGPLEYVHGKQQIIPGLEKKLEDHKVGDQLDVVVGPEDGYGIVDPRAVVEMAKSKLPEDEEIEEGSSLWATGPDGKKFYGVVREVKWDSVIIDFNHPLAGKELHFHVEVVSIEEAA